MFAIIDELKKQSVKSNDNTFIIISSFAWSGNPKQGKPDVMYTQTFVENIIKYQNSTF